MNSHRPFGTLTYQDKLRAILWNVHQATPLYFHRGALSVLEQQPNGRQRPKALTRAEFRVYARCLCPLGRTDNRGIHFPDKLTREECDNAFDGAKPLGCALPLTEVVSGPYAYRGTAAGSGQITTHTAHGYNADTRTFLDLGQTPSQAAPSSDVIRHFLLKAFTAADDAGRAAIIGLFVQGVVRRVYDDIAPGWLISATRSSAGKTYIIACLAALLDGGQPRTISVDDRAELRRQVDAAAQSPAQVLLIDNLDEGVAFAGRSLLASITNKELHTRKIGTSDEMTVALYRKVFALTGIEVTVGDEMRSRLVEIHLDRPNDNYPCEDPLGWIQQHRQAVLLEILRWTQAWAAAGAPPPPSSDSEVARRFKAWNRVVGGIVCHTFPELAQSWLGSSTRPSDPMRLELLTLIHSGEWPRAADGSWAAGKAGDVAAVVIANRNSYPALWARLGRPKAPGLSAAQKLGNILKRYSRGSDALFHSPPTRAAGSRSYVPLPDPRERTCAVGVVVAEPPPGRPHPATGEKKYPTGQDS